MLFLKRFCHNSSIFSNHTAEQEITTYGSKDCWTQCNTDGSRNKTNYTNVSGGFFGELLLLYWYYHYYYYYLFYLVQQVLKKIKRLTEASEKIVNSYDSLQKEMHSEHEKDEDCNKLTSKMDTVIQSCANQHMVLKEVFTEKHLKKKILPLDYEIMFSNTQ